MWAGAPPRADRDSTMWPEKDEKVGDVFLSKHGGVSTSVFNGLNETGVKKKIQLQRPQRELNVGNPRCSKDFMRDA